MWSKKWGNSAPNASGVIMVHNHPSGNLKPSIIDDNLTKNIAQVMQIIDCKLSDHIIITSSGYYSYADECKHQLNGI